MASADWELEKSEDEFKVNRKGSNLKITLTRPRKGNVLIIEMVKALTAIYQEAAKDLGTFRTFLAAEGKYFCAGMDLAAKGGVLDTNQEAKQDHKATLALINGPAFGAGCGLIFSFDIRIAVENTTFDISEAKVGLAPAVIMKQIFREWEIGKAREAILTARPVGPEELLKMGAVHAMVRDPIQLDESVQTYIDHLDACGPEAMTGIKEICLASDTERPRKIKATYDTMMKPTPEARHGVESFHAKRTPDWVEFYSRLKEKL